MGVKILVLDEADPLLDVGFRKDIEKIVASVSKERQTLLFFFSATIPDEVKQMHLIALLENQFPLLYSIRKDHISDDLSYKVLVFSTTAMVTRLVSDLLDQLKLNVREIHSRKP